jgi:hypothetical protein
VPTAVQTWEYFEELVKVQDVVKACQHHGGDGWELAGLLQCGVAQSNVIVRGQGLVPGAHLIFKRPRTLVEANGHAADT